MAGPVQASRGFGPAEHLLVALSNDLADLVAGMRLVRPSMAEPVALAATWRAKLIQRSSLTSPRSRSVIGRSFY